MKILVTGATGFIGRALTSRLLQIGHEVRIIGRKPNTTDQGLKSKAEFYLGDITDLESMKSATKGIHSIFHLAGLVGYSRSMQQAMVQVNVVGTANVLEAAIQNNVQKIVHMSSVVAVGASFDGSILNESSPYGLSHLNLGYFETKRRAEQIVMAATKENKIHAVCVNPATVYGAGDATKGSRTVQIRIAKGGFPFYTGGGVNVIHIDDVVNATYRAWEIGTPGERYILSGENLTIKDLFFQIANAAKVNPPRLFLPNWLLHLAGRLGDTLETRNIKFPVNSETAWTSSLFHWFDNTKARTKLGLNPKSASIAIQESVNWMKDNRII